MEEPKKRRPLVALLLTILTPGLGHLYNGQSRRAGLVYLGSLSTYAILGYLLSTFKGMVIGFGLLVGYVLWAAIDAAYSAVKIKEVTLKPFNRWYIYLAVILVQALAITPLIKSFALPVKTYKIASGSMSPTLEAGDLIMAAARYYEKEALKRGDIVIFAYPADPSKNFIMRVIGLSGETIEIRDKVVYVNGEPLEEKYVKHTDPRTIPASVNPRDNLEPTVVPLRSFFVLGDNRDNSHDSRFWKFVDRSALKGKVLYIYWSTDMDRVGMDVN